MERGIANDSDDLQSHRSARVREGFGDETRAGSPAVSGREPGDPAVHAPSAVRPTAEAVGTRSFDSAELFAGGTEIRIVHQQAVYHLKITRQGKLILNK